MQRLTKVALAALALSAYATAAWAGGKNLKYYKPDMTIEDLKAEMKILQRSVGAEDCAYCHVVKPRRDFASDAVPAKKTTREMLVMVDKINSDYFTKNALGIKEGDVPKATCFMCHHSKEKPEYKAANADQEKLQAKFEEECKKPEHAAMVTAMKKVVDKLNKDQFTWAKAPKATCWMCHRGAVEFSTKAPEDN